MVSTETSYATSVIGGHLRALGKSVVGMFGEVGRPRSRAEDLLAFFLGLELRVEHAAGDLFDIDVVLLTGGDLHRRRTVLAELELNDRVRGVPDGAVVL